MGQDTKYLDAETAASITNLFRTSKRKLLLFDYDGTLVPFKCEPSEALPEAALLKLLKGFTEIEDLDLVIISGRNAEFLEEVFGNLNITLFAEHGAIYRINGKWDALPGNLSWKTAITEIMKEYVSLTPGSSIETKQKSIVWHHRKSDRELGEKMAQELVRKLFDVCDREDLTIMKGNKIVEVKPSDYTKGTAIVSFFDYNSYDFLLAAGDDVTDMDLFDTLPGRAIKIHIGLNPGGGGYSFPNSFEFLKFLDDLAF